MLVVIFDFIGNSLLYWCPEVLLICLSLGSQTVPLVHLKARLYASVPDPLMCPWGRLIHIKKWYFHLKRVLTEHCKVKHSPQNTSHMMMMHTLTHSFCFNEWVIDVDMISSGIFRCFWLCNKTSSPRKDKHTFRVL